MLGGCNWREKIQDWHETDSLHACCPLHPLPPILLPVLALLFRLPLLLRLPPHCPLSRSHTSRPIPSADSTEKAVICSKPRGGVSKNKPCRDLMIAMPHWQQCSIELVAWLVHTLINWLVGIGWPLNSALPRASWKETKTSTYTHTHSHTRTQFLLLQQGGQLHYK